MDPGAEDGADVAPPPPDPDGLLGGFSRAFDLIQAEYGWGDAVLLDMPLRRLRQCVAAINERMKLIDERRRRMVEWQTRSLASFIAATIPAGKKGEKNPLLEAAHNLSMTGNPDIPTETVDEFDPANHEAAVRRAAGRNPRGSFERLMKGMPQ